MKLHIVLFLVLFVHVQMSAQNWELGLTGGIANYQGDIVEPRYDIGNAELAYGLFLQRNFNHQFGLRLGFNSGNLGADDRDYDRFDENMSEPLDFQTAISQLHLRLDYNLFGKYKKYYDKEGNALPDSIIMRDDVPLYNNKGELVGIDERKTRSWSPYVFAGPSLTLLNENMQQQDINGLAPYRNSERWMEDDNEVPGSAFSMLFGGGFNFFLSDDLKLGLEFNWVAPFTDYLDGVSAVRNPDNNDFYTMTLLKLSTSISPKDTDGDGLLDKDDKCPEDPGPIENDGCPDRDGDGITDRADKCPDTPGVRALRGCPDTDEDGIADQEDDCPSLAGPESNNGCPDADGDGIIDPEDNCVNTPGLPEYAGCPDTDGDGIIDNRDDCPQVKGIVALNGCPDTDGDGIADSEDDCPNEAGVAANDGCPEVKTEDEEVIIEEEDQEKLDFAAQNIQFELNSANLTEESREIMDEVGEILNRYDQYNVQISGHTDNSGSEEYNLNLSEERAKACWDYLKNESGVKPDRMSYAGYGESQPIADNETEEGRKLNRRVEFKLVQK